jgi:aminoglycoside phosphotransferase family enzyme
MKANNEYPFVFPLCVPFMRTYRAVVLAKVTSVTEYDAPVVVLYTSVQVVESVDV